MLKCCLILIILILTLYSCENYNKIKSRELELKFYPSWLTNSTFKIDLNSNKYSFVIERGAISFNNDSSIDIDKNIVDTGQINSQINIELNDLIIEMGDVDSDKGVGRDGISIFFNLMSYTEDTIHKEFWSPEKNTTIGKLKSKILEMLQNNCNDNFMKIYLSELKKY